MIDFYVECGGSSYYIFTRKYRTALFRFFKNSVRVDKLFDFSKAHGNEVIINTMIRLKVMLKYVEQENELHILEGERGRQQSYRREKMYDYDLVA